jgi:hypothetical protein
MISNRKKPTGLSRYTRELLQIVDRYVEETGDKEPDLRDAARWAHAEGLLETPSIDVIRVMARALARACRQDYIVDENGEPVRRRHAVREERGQEQMTLWPKIEDMSPQKMRKSLQVRKQGTLQDALQIERDRRYFNTHYNPGDPIPMDYNLNPDIEEHFLPSVYPEKPPEDPPQDQWAE